MCNAHEKSVSNIIEKQKQKKTKKNKKMLNKRLNDFSQDARLSSDSIKQLKDNTGDLEEKLTFNQDLVKEKLNTLKSQLRVKNKVGENKAELKEKIRMQKE